MESQTERERDGAWIIITRVRGSDILYIETRLESKEIKGGEGGEEEKKETDRQREKEMVHGQHQNYITIITSYVAKQ